MATVQYEAVVMYVKMPSYYPSLKDRVDVCTNAASVVCKDLYQVLEILKNLYQFSTILDRAETSAI